MTRYLARKQVERLRDPVSGLTHLIAGVFALVGFVVLLVVGRGDLQKQISLAIYGLSLTLMMFSSAAYHLVNAQSERTLTLRKLDHVAIYLLIAGTYTPFCINQLTGFYRWGLLGIVWGLALAGVVSKMFMMYAPRGLTAGIYLIMGWLSVIMVRELVIALPTGALLWLFLGGAFYTFGAIIYITKRMDFVPGVFGFHEVWHIFVILGALCHFISILTYIAPAARVV
jgi:hemolysin III